MMNEKIAELQAYKDVNEDFKTAWEELKAENERLKTQYNCYACGNCRGKEDYKNLEKHHLGLRKQFDKKVQTLRKIKEYLNGHKIADEVRIKCVLDLITEAESEG